jgi:hypothetical protein
MSEFQARLSGSGLGHLPFEKYSHDFEFVVGSQSYPCPSFLADFLSPRIARVHSSETTFSRYIVETGDSDCLFPSFLRLGTGGCLKVNPSNLLFFCLLSRELENAELFDILERNLNRELRLEDVCERLAVRRELGLVTTREIDFLAVHFYEISDSLIADLTFEDILAVLQNDHLQVKSEDSLYYCIAERFQEDPGFVRLLQYIHFDFLSLDAMANFVKASEHILPFIDQSVWRSICARLLLPVNVAQQPGTQTRYFEGHRFDFKPDTPLDGIISYLTRKYGGNVHDMNAVTVTASAVLDSRVPKNVADLEADSYFISVNAPNQWLCYDFKDMQIKPTHYSIRSRCDRGADFNQLKSWVVETSLDGNKWQVIDKRENTTDLNAQNVVKTFDVNSSQQCRYIRILFTDRCHGGNYHIGFSSFEIFGVLIERKVED